MLFRALVRHRANGIGRCAALPFALSDAADPFRVVHLIAPGARHIVLIEMVHL